MLLKGDISNIEVRITHDSSREGLVVGLEDFNFLYPEDIVREDDKYAIFRLSDYYAILIKDGKEFEEKEKKPVEEAAIELPQNFQSKDNYIKDLISILKQLDVKTVIFKDGNSININHDEEKGEG